RRARRVLPAALLVLAVTVLLSTFLLPPLQVPDVTADATAAALYVSNIRFAVQSTDYLAAQLAPSPLLHFWSLGVEEQFYLFWPALLAVVATIGLGTIGLGRRRQARPLPGGAATTRRLAIAVAAVGIGSFALSLILTTAAEPWAF